MEHGALILVEIGAVVLVLAVMARIAIRLQISPIPLYLLAGLALGEGGLVPVVTSESFIEIGAQFGVIFLLLMLGLEYSARELVVNMRAVAPAGLVDLVINFLPGLVTGLLLGWGITTAIFLGGVTYISSSGVIAKLLNDLGWTGNRETPIVLSILVFEDLAMAVMLPILGVMALGTTLSAAVVTVALAMVVIVFILVFAARQGDRIGATVFSRSDEASLLAVFGLTMLVAGFAEQLHISSAVGAFLVGISVSGEAAERARVLLAPLRDLFAAVFFVFFGLSIDPRDIPGVALIAVVLGVVTAATKYWGAWWAARRQGIGPKGRMRAGAVLIARGEFSIVIAGLGAAAGAGAELGTLAAAYVLFMAVAGPIAGKVVDSRLRPTVVT